jgi:hypothetical protein
MAVAAAAYRRGAGRNRFPGVIAPCASPTSIAGFFHVDKVYA